MLYKTFTITAYSIPMRILIIEDNIKLVNSLKRGFEQEGYAADAVLDGEEGERKAIMGKSDYDAIILDVSLPKKSGLEVCRTLRENKCMTPIIMLTARDTVQDTIAGLDIGADDYMVKPFSFEELLSRVRALTRRPRITLAPDLVFGTLVLKAKTQEVFQENKKVDLTLKEFRILEFFMSRPDEVINRQALVDHLWDFQFNPMSRVMDVHINNVRNKLKIKHGTTLETVRGIGYRLKA